MGWKEKLLRFMYGRYGIDQLSKFMVTVSFVLCILSIFVGGRMGRLISNIIFVLIILIYFRMFSRNIYKRAAENEKYLKLTSKIRQKYNTEKSIAKQRKYYRFYRCPRCNQRIRVPKGRGRIQIRCPKCNEKFIKNS